MVTIWLHTFPTGENDQRVWIFLHVCFLSTWEIIVPVHSFSVLTSCYCPLSTGSSDWRLGVLTPGPVPLNEAASHISTQTPCFLCYFAQERIFGLLNVKRLYIETSVEVAKNSMHHFPLRRELRCRRLRLTERRESFIHRARCGTLPPPCGHSRTNTVLNA